MAMLGQKVQNKPVLGLESHSYLMRKTLYCTIGTVDRSGVEKNESMQRPTRARKSKRMLNPNDPSNPYSQHNFESPYSQPGLSTQNSQSPRSNRKKRSGCLSCFLLSLIIFGVIVVFCAVTSIFSGGIAAIQSHSPAIFFQGDLPFGGVGVAVLVGVTLMFCFVLIKTLGRGKSLGKRAGIVVLALFIIATSVGVFWSFFINPNIGMTRTGFMRTATVDITVGDAVYFRNPANGVTQILCVGTDQHCQSGDNDPSQLKNGLVIQPGQTVRVVFDTADTYQITSKTTPHMNITISVNEPIDTTP